MNKYRYKIIKEHNLILAQIINTTDEIHESIKKICAMIAADKDYKHDMDFISDMKKPNYPADELYYNKMARTLRVNVRFNRFVRMICPMDQELKRNYRVFMIFAQDSKDVSKESYFVRNISEALEKLDKQDIPELKKELEDFYSSYCLE